MISPILNTVTGHQNQEGKCRKVDLHVAGNTKEHHETKRKGRREAPPLLVLA